jgi:uncharacterized protein (DUF1800 family)
MRASKQIVIGLLVVMGPMTAPRIGAMEPREAVQLLVRTGHGTSPAEMTPLADLTLEQAVRRMLDAVQTRAQTPPPDWVNDPALPPDRAAMQQMTPEERQQMQRERQRTQNLQRTELIAWWYQEMVATESPLTEHMTLFWHNHLTSSFQKVRRPELMYRQNVLLRGYALGNFGGLLHAIAKDPAMILYLDNQTNRRGRPNENFARELMELFTLGEGHYSEQDIKEAARAFTGWMIDARSGEFVYNPRQHDGGMKTFFGRSGNWNGDDILNMLLEQPRTAVFVTEKLWRDLVSDTPDAQEVERLAKIFRDHNYEMRPLVEAMLTCPAFRDSAHRGALVKSPSELMVGTARTLGLPVGDGRLLIQSGRQMGQALMDPPNVKGWPGGVAWIDADSLLARRRFLDLATRGVDLNPAMQRAVMAGQPAAMDRLDRMEAAGERAGARAGQRQQVARAGQRQGLRGADRAGTRRGVARGNANAMNPSANALYRMYSEWEQAGLTDPAQLAQLLLPVDPVEATPDDADTPLGRLEWIQRLMLDPVYQLK